MKHLAHGVRFCVTLVFCVARFVSILSILKMYLRHLTHEVRFFVSHSFSPPRWHKPLFSYFLRTGHTGTCVYIHVYPAAAVYGQSRCAPPPKPPLYSPLLQLQPYMANLAVHPSFRGLGIGRGLVQQAVRDLSLGGNRPSSRVYLEVAQENLEALRVYEGAGFERIRRGGESKQGLIMLEHRLGET